MATITPTIDQQSASSDNSVIVATWAMTAAADTAVPISFPAWADKTWVITGTFSSATVTMHGSNDGTNFAPLTGRAGGAQTATSAAACFTSADRPVWVKPVMGGSGACTIQVTVSCHRTDLAGNAR